MDREVKPSDIVKHMMISVVTITGSTLAFTGKMIKAAGDYVVKLGTSK